MSIPICCLRVLAALALATLISSPASAAVGDALINDYPDSKLRKVSTLAYGQLAVPVGISEKTLQYESLTGDIRRSFSVVKGVSTLQIYEDYSAALEEAGFELVFSCALQVCGDNAEGIGAALSPEETVYNWHRAAYYLVARKDSDGDSVWVAMFAGGHNDESAIQLATVAERALQTGAVAFDAELLKKLAAVPKPVLPVEALEDDNPLLPRYPGSKLRKSSRSEYEPIELPEGPANAIKPNTIPKLQIVGNSTAHFYLVENVSTLKLYENYRAALLDAGFETQFTCRLADCGESEQAQKLGNSVSVEGSVYNYYRNPYYLLASKDAPEGALYVSLFFGGHGDTSAIQQTIVEARALETGFVKLDAETLEQQLEQDGKALIYGIYFDTDMSVVKPESKEALETIAEVLNNDSALSLYVVGHTDDAGSETHNRALAESRATAVVEALTEHFNVARKQLQAEGVGPFAPAASNATVIGRQLNRRVELVKRLQ